MIDGNFIVKKGQKISERHSKKFTCKFLTVTKNLKNTDMISLSSVMTSVTMFTLNQNLTL